MVPQGPTGEERSWPYFFMSHAHPKGAREDDPPESTPRRLVHQLYTELCWHLREICDPIEVTGDNVRMGWVDSEIQVGTDWGRWLADQLATCRVFVPLLSPAYFKSDMCGREWKAFSERRTEPRWPGWEHTESIVPICWAPLPGEMPAIAAKIQHISGEFPPSYQRTGLYGLMARPKMREDREETIYLLAERIRDVAYRNCINRGKPRQNLDDVPSAFGEESGPPLLHVGRPPGGRAGRAEEVDGDEAAGRGWGRARPGEGRPGRRCRHRRSRPRRPPRPWRGRWR
ncbi:TIR-like protein FxsC [Phaeacidiphilus oryzae]|uniref:TIR-like protein FxsC n=1 Tax=Phaeacidiphilus oryzae TaxID=348818 RepID=UPI00068C06F2|nr:TIR-like protein FxsC [Phaeacidiphilus oryzae]